MAAVKGSWDVFALLVTAASVQLGGQLVRWLGGRSSNGSARRNTNGRVARVPRGGGADDAAAVLQRGPPRVLRPDPRFGGMWVKDPSRSDSMDEAVAVMRLNGIVRTAIRLIRGVEVDTADLKAGRFNMAVCSVISWFKVREIYQLDGTVGYYNRRDLRRGKHAAFVTINPDGSLVLSVSWGDPLPGSGSDHFVLVPAEQAGGAPATADGLVAGQAAAGSEPEARDGDILVVTSTLRLAGPPEAAAAGGAREGAAAPPAPVVYRTVYVRAGRGRRHHEGQHHQQQQVPHPEQLRHHEDGERH